MSVGITAAVVVACVLIAASVAVGIRVGRLGEVKRQAAAGRAAEETSQRIVAEGQREADTLRKSAVLAGREELMKLREAWELEVRDRRTDVERDEKRLKEKESVLDRKFEVLDQREKDTNVRAGDVARLQKRQTEREQELDRLTQDAQRRLEQLAGMSAADAKAELIHRIEEAAQADAANRLREIRESTRRTAEREAKKIVALAVQRIAAEHTAESTASAVALPNDEM